MTAAVDAPTVPLTRAGNQQRRNDEPRAVQLTWRHAVLAVVALDLTYAAVIISGVGLAGEERLLTPQLNQIIVGALITTTVASLGLLIGSNVVDLLRTIRAEVAELRSTLNATVLDPSDEALPYGMRRHVGRIYAAVADGRMQLLADAQAEQVRTLAEMRSLVEQAVQRGAAGAPRRRRQRNGRHRNGLSDAELRGYLTGVYDRERGNEGPQ